MRRAIVVGGIVLALLLVWGVKQIAFPNTEPCTVCEGSGSAACGAAGCVLGKVTCNGPCLRKDTPGWEPREVPGHPADLLWMAFSNPDGSVQWVSQNHLGQVMEEVNGEWRLTGVCKVCKGSMRMPCPACQGKEHCPNCSGKGHIRKWF